MTLKKADSKKMLAKDLEGPAMRRKRVERDDMRRSLKAKYDKCCVDNLEEMLIKWQSKQMAMEDIVKKLEQEQAKVVDKEYKAAGDSGSGAGESQLVLYVTNQTGNRHIRYRCNRLKLNFVCLRIQYTEIDVAGNKWLRDKVSREAKNDDLPLLFYGLGEGGKYIGEFDTIVQQTDDGTLYEFLESFGYVHPHKKCKHFIYSGNTSRIQIKQ